MTGTINRIQAFAFTNREPGPMDGQTLVWNVSKAIELINARAHVTDVLTISIADVRKVLALNGCAQEIDDAHALTKDLKSPIIIIESPFVEGRSIIIDGWHRLKKADLTDAPSVYAVVLTEEEEKECRI